MIYSFHHFLKPLHFKKSMSTLDSLIMCFTVVIISLAMSVFLICFFLETHLSDLLFPLLLFQNIQLAGFWFLPFQVPPELPWMECRSVVACCFCAFSFSVSEVYFLQWYCKLLMVGSCSTSIETSLGNDQFSEMSSKCRWLLSFESFSGSYLFSFLGLNRCCPFGLVLSSLVLDYGIFMMPRKSWY